MHNCNMIFFHFLNLKMHNNQIVEKFLSHIQFCNNHSKFYFKVDAFSGYRVKRQDSDDEEEDTQKKICEEAGAEAGEWFRLQAGEDKCRDVVSCTASVRNILI